VSTSNCEVSRLSATKHIRRMPGGSQSHLMTCSDGHDYVVKFQGNPQGSRTLVNDLLGTMLAKFLTLPVADVAIVEVSKDVIQESFLRMQYERHSQPCQAGLCFGSRYLAPHSPASFRSASVKPNTLSRDYLRSLSNMKDFAGMLVFDKWSCNTDSRQFIFVRPEGSCADKVFMIDEGFCFHATHWDFHDFKLQGVVADRFVYDLIEGMEAFEPWLEILENDMSAHAMKGLASEIPLEWYAFDSEALVLLVSCLARRIPLVRELIRSSCSALPHSFRHWTTHHQSLGSKHGLAQSESSMADYLPFYPHVPVVDGVTKLMPESRL